MTADPFGFDGVDVDWLRAKTGAKWHRHPGLLAAWVADMDMAPAPVILEAIRARADRADLGYPDWGWPRARTPLCALFAERAERRYAWRFDHAEVREFCDVVQAVQVMLHLATEPGDGVVLHMPSYPPLWKSLAEMDRRLIDVPTHFDPTHFDPTHGGSHAVQFDYDQLETRLRHERATVLLLCHPHNPTGHRFGRDELTRLVAIAERFDLLIISDEIHADLTYAPHVHVPIASIPGAASRTVSVHSASKAFNIAGMRHAIAHVGPDALRDRLDRLPNHLLGAINLIGAEAAEAAWRHGDDWLAAVLAHLDRNRSLLAGLLAERLPGVRYRQPDATYLAWLDCRSLDLPAEPVDVFRARGVELSNGLDFGRGGAGHVRLNFATSEALLATIVERMAG